MGFYHSDLNRIILYHYDIYFVYKCWISSSLIKWLVQSVCFVNVWFAGDVYRIIILVCGVQYRLFIKRSEAADDEGCDEHKRSCSDLTADDPSSDLPELIRRSAR